MAAPWLALQARVRKFGPKLLQLLAEWTETFPRDFQEESTIGHLKDVMGRIAPCDEVGRPSASPTPLSAPLHPGPEPIRGASLGTHVFPSVHRNSSKINPFLPHREVRACGAGKETTPLAPGVSWPCSCPVLIRGTRGQARKDSWALVIH